MKREFSVGPEDAGQTLSALLKRQAKVPWSRARRMCERGQVRVDGRRSTDAALRLRIGQKIAVDEAAPPAPPEVRVTIAWEDAHVVVIDKPAGVSSVPYETREKGTAMDLLRDAWRAAGKRATETPLHVVHRIDKETSGLLAFAKTKVAERALAALLRAHEVERTYLCVAHGTVRDRRIESRLVTDRGDGLRGSSHGRT